MKFFDQLYNQKRTNRRSREGAWIEMDVWLISYDCMEGRSREGAWIEIKALYKALYAKYSRSREGAWIEMVME